MAAAPCHSDRGMLTTHYKYITAEKKCCIMQVRLYKLAGYMVDWQIEKFGSRWLQIQPLGKFSRHG